jgi:RNA-binding protein 39
LFDPFGNIDYIDIHRDPETGKCKGFAYIQYSNIEDAKRAVK